MDEMITNAEGQSLINYIVNIMSGKEGEGETLSLCVCVCVCVCVWVGGWVGGH